VRRPTDSLLIAIGEQRVDLVNEGALLVHGALDVVELRVQVVHRRLVVDGEPGRRALRIVDACALVVLQADKVA